MATTTANYGFIKSIIFKKILMALTGLFLCTFLIVHLAGNLQLFIPGFEGKLAFNQYSVFMTTFPLIRIASIITFIGIIVHVADSVYLILKNKKARPVGYAVPPTSSPWSSRNMGILGSIILFFLVVHLSGFWYTYKFGTVPAMFEAGNPVTINGDIIKGGMVSGSSVILNGVIIAPVMKDLHEVVVTSFKELWIVIVYVLSMIALGFHLSHGFASAFQTLGINHPVYTPFIKKTGLVFSVLVPLGFALIPLYIFFS
jgi:succinate dehydrogenase / fumarate reductase cytochrome b subunit